VTTKDLSIWLLKTLGQEAGIYRSLEFCGPGLSWLSLESRMVLPNMMAESGAKNAYLRPDASVIEWVARRLAIRTGTPLPDCLERVCAEALYPDPDAEYVAVMEVDLDTLEPLVACPHNPSSAAPLSDIAGTPVQQAFIGTCTNGRLADLAEAAAVLRTPDGRVRRLATGTRLLVIPASNQVLREAIAAGYVDTFLEAGAMLGTPGCGPCMGNHMGVPASGETVISTANRNFRGRMGNPESSIYLAGPGVVAASAVTGRITDPRDLPSSRAVSNHAAAQIPTGDQPRLRREALRLRPLASKHREAPREQRMGSASRPGDSGSVPTGFLVGRAWVYGDDVNTDVIFPGKYTYSVVERHDLARHALEDLDPSFAGSVLPGDMIVAGTNWGCGSSREQAVTCLMAAGVRVIIAVSFARIYYRNAVNNGLLPVVCPDAAASIRAGDTVTVDLSANLVRSDAGVFSFEPPSDSVRRIISAGGLAEMLRQQHLAIAPGRLADRLHQEESCTSSA
jgi:3-isopropylmalate dehydratase small subunit